MPQLFSSATMKLQAAALGFNRVGVTRAEPSPHLSAYREWVAAGMHASMGYMARPDRVARREDLNIILPGARSLVLVGLDYTAMRPRKESAGRGRIAAYAFGDDYHRVMEPRLRELAAWLAAQSGDAPAWKVYVDTGALLERSHAQQAGLGFIGKNTMLIHPRRGSSFFIGEIITDLAFDIYDTPLADSLCGACTRCLNACPTDAFPRPFVLDARRCISYLTIEHKGSIPQELRPKMGSWVYGCDICNAVCPWNRFAMPPTEPTFSPAHEDHVAPPLDWLLNLTDDTFAEHFAGSAILRIKRARLLRNACVAAGNSGERALIPLLERLAAGDADEWVREAAMWARTTLEKQVK